nr:hypothetical protein CFP56_26398 [Quercus suber]
MTRKGPVTLDPIQRLVTHKDYAIKMVTSIIKETDLDPCGEHSSEDLRYSGLYDLSRALVSMKALQDRCVANKGELMAKTKVLAKETHRLEEAEKAKTNLVIELAALRKQMEKAKANAMVEFRISQPFFDACGIYYGDEFEDCLKQVRAAYPNLDLSQIVIDDIVSLMLEGDDIVSNEIIDFIHTVEQEVKDIDSVVIAQPTSDGPDAVVVSSAENPTTVEGLPTVNPTAPNALPS